MDELVKRLRSLKVLLGTDSPEVRGWSSAVQQAAQKTVNDAIAALSAQPQQEPVARVKRNSGCGGREFIGESLEFRDLPVGTKLYTAPPSGVREGIALQELQNIVNAKRFDVDKFDDDTDFADWAQSRARHAITRAAEQVNAGGQESGKPVKAADNPATGGIRSPAPSAPLTAQPAAEPVAWMHYHKGGGYCPLLYDWANPRLGDTVRPMYFRDDKPAYACTHPGDAAPVADRKEGVR